jgi:hypothetical protein
MQAAGTSETPVNLYHTIRRYNPEDSHLRTHRLENLKFTKIKKYLCMCMKVCSDTLYIKTCFTGCECLLVNLNKRHVFVHRPRYLVRMS